MKSEHIPIIGHHHLEPPTANSTYGRKLSSNIFPETSDEFTATPVCKHHIQIVQVQDATSSFNDALQDWKQGHYISNLLNDLRLKYGPLIDYGLTTFQDKPGPLTGYTGDNSGWKSGGTSTNTTDREDQCYELLHPLSNDERSLQTALWYIPNGGGKDYMENQWDALWRSAVDPDIGWDLRSHDDDGYPITRISIVLTDGGAHTAPDTFSSQVRNLNREYYKNEGPWRSFTGKNMVTTQKCDIETTLKMGNNVRENPRAPKSVSTDGGECFGWSAPKAGTLRSLKGSLAYYYFYYGFGETNRLTDRVECGGTSNNIELDDDDDNDNDNDDITECGYFEAFLNCCTLWGVSTQMDCIDGSDYKQKFPDFDACLNYGGRYSRCHPDLYNGQTLSLDYPGNRQLSCVYDTKEWEEAQTRDASEEFFRGLGISSDLERPGFVDLLNDITDYPYDESVFERSCSSFEYPNPLLKRYGLPFKKRGITPWIIAAPPASTIMNNPGKSLASDLRAYNVHALRMSEQNCPGLEWDPWTSFTCALGGNMDYCYPPHVAAYSAMYPNQDDWDNPGIFGETGKRFYEQPYGCSYGQCATKWWTQCMENEYWTPLQYLLLTNRLDKAGFHMMSPNYGAQTINYEIERAVDAVMKDVPCVMGEVVRPSTTTSTTTTDAATTTTTNEITSSTASTRTTAFTSSTTTMMASTSTLEVDLIPTTLSPGYWTTYGVTGSHDENDLPTLSERSTASNTATSSQSTSSVPEDEESSSMGIIVGAAVGGTAAIAGLGVGIFYAIKNIRMNHQAEKPSRPIDISVDSMEITREQWVKWDEDMYQ